MPADDANPQIENKNVLSEQEKLNARRELRRKRLLANAKSRLAKLNGRNIGDQLIIDDNKSETTQFSDPEVEPDAIPTTAFTSSAETNGEATFSFTDINSNETVKEHTVLKWKLHIIVSVIIGYVCALYLNEQARYSIFLPSGLCVIFDTIFCRAQKQMNPIASAVVALLGLQPHKANTLFYIYYLTKHLLIDLSVVVFLVCTLGYALHNVSDQFVFLMQFK